MTRPKAALATSVVITVAVLIVLCVGAIMPIIQAKRLTRELETTDWSRQSSGFVREFVSQNKGHLDCDDRGCVGYIERYNRMLAGLHLAPTTGIRIALSFDKEHVHPTEVAITAMSWRKSPAIVTLKQCLITSEQYSNCDRRFEVKRLPSLNAIEVHYSPDRKSILRDIRFSCMARIGGCSEEQLVPGIVSALKDREPYMDSAR